MRMPKSATGPSGPLPAGPGDARPVTGAAPGRRLRAARLGSLIIPAARRHWLMTALLLAGLVLRVLAQVAYRPALLYIDTLKYLYNAWPGTDPLGYKGVLKAILLVGNLQAVTAVQHLVGLAMGVGIYLVVLRRGAPRWLAALAAAPVLLDGYELQTEQTIMPDVWFEALIVAALVLLLWRPRPRPRAIALAGIALGLSVTVAQAGEILILPAAIYAVVAAGSWRRAVGGAALMCVSFAVPILAYMSISDVVSGHFWLSRSGETTIYGRVAEAADCATLKLPSYERALCPTAQQKALGPDGLDHAASSPLTLYVAPPGMSQTGIVQSFTEAVIKQQPLRVLGSTAADAARLFAVTRVTSPGDTPISRWQFQAGYPSYQNYIRTNPDNVIIVGLKVQNPPPNYVYQPLDPSMGGKADVIRPLAAFLRSYQLNGGYTPGPLYLAATVFGLAGTLALLRRRVRARDRDRELALASCLFFLTAAAILLFSDIPEFSWRYQLPAIETLPPAGALGLALILARLGDRRRRAAVAGAGAGGAPDGAGAPGGTARAPDGGAEAPGGGAGAPGGSAEVPGGGAGAPGRTAATPAGGAGAPGGGAGGPDRIVPAFHGTSTAPDGTAANGAAADPDMAGAGPERVAGPNGTVAPNGATDNGIAGAGREDAAPRFS
jgi:hypothetical protein